MRTLIPALAALLATVSTAFAAPAEAIAPKDLERILAAERGKIVVVNLWATWCAPCLTEIPDLIRLESDLADLNVALIGISVDEPRGSTAAIETMRDKRFPSFRTYARDKTEVDYLVSVIDSAWNEVVPTTYVIDRDGKVAKRIQGKKSLEEFKAEVAAVAR
ncbi:MAG: TlpA family protein disulfide reductase [Alphaproteobacteria bacterium]|nr:TlpA family protein disulfide reductase [Alphaproteobacteria bacterium]